MLNHEADARFSAAVWDKLTFPATLRIDYVRVYQKGTPKIGCDPPDHPTVDYINRHPELYQNRERCPRCSAFRPAMR